MKKYFNEMKREELREIITHNNRLWSELAEVASEDNSIYQQEIAEEMLGKNYGNWTKADITSYDWWLHPKSGEYRHILDIASIDYLSDEDRQAFKRLQKKLQAVVEKINDLEDCEDYYYKLDEYEEDADELADKALQIVVNMLKQLEEITDEQILDIAEEGDYYINNNDYKIVYKDITKVYQGA